VIDCTWICRREDALSRTQHLVCLQQMLCHKQSRLLTAMLLLCRHRSSHTATLSWSNLASASAVRMQLVASLVTLGTQYVSSPVRSPFSRYSHGPGAVVLQRKLMERNVAEEIAAKVVDSVAQTLEGQKLSSFTGVLSGACCSRPSSWGPLGPGFQQSSCSR